MRQYLVFVGNFPNLDCFWHVWMVALDSGIFYKTRSLWLGIIQLQWKMSLVFATTIWKYLSAVDGIAKWSFGLHRDQANWIKLENAMSLCLSITWASHTHYSSQHIKTDLYMFGTYKLICNPKILAHQMFWNHLWSMEQHVLLASQTGKDLPSDQSKAGVE